MSPRLFEFAILSLFFGAFIGVGAMLSDSSAVLKAHTFGIYASLALVTLLTPSVVARPSPLLPRFGQTRVHVALFFLAVAYFCAVFAAYGIPLFQPDVQVFRVEIERKAGLAYVTTKYLLYLETLILALRCRARWQWGFVLIACVLMLLTGFRSRAIEPLVLFILLRLFMGVPVWRIATTFVVPMLVAVAVMTYITSIRSPEATYVEALGRLASRLFIINYEINIANVVEIFRDDLQYGLTYLDDLRSVLSAEYSGFGKTATALTGFDQFETFQMTPTVVSELYANFGYCAWMAAGAIALFVRSLLGIVNATLRRYFGDLGFVAGWLSLVLLWRIGIPHGFGPFLAVHWPRVLIVVAIAALAIGGSHALRLANQNARKEAARAG